ncbi:twin-arginine translocase TatA/TatE family subunit [Microbacterium sp. F51-2R]|jgi:sec-independent protein translocase protein TatA|uniref:twin-arginine translocase TatA/TatE family subunit n=1 Tax=Microbacterium sp. F51-2R TaxID=3445777 RepID=UPI003F9ED37D
MFANLNGTHLLILVAVLLLLFGATKLPALARGVGQSVRILRSEVRAADDEGEGAKASGSSAAAVVAPRAAEGPTPRE